MYFGVLDITVSLHHATKRIDAFSVQDQFHLEKRSRILKAGPHPKCLLPIIEKIKKIFMAL